MNKEIHKITNTEKCKCSGVITIEEVYEIHEDYSFNAGCNKVECTNCDTPTPEHYGSLYEYLINIDELRWMTMMHQDLNIKQYLGLEPLPEWLMNEYKKEGLI